jgi:hypothetical protein
LLQKERIALMPDEDFEGDFIEVQENQGITNAAGRFSTDSIPRAA